MITRNMELAKDLEARWNNIRRYMVSAGMDACILSADVNLYYATGRVYNGYFYLPAEGEPRFFVKKPVDISGENIEFIRKPEQIAEIFGREGIKLPARLMLEGDELTYNEYVRLLAVFEPEKTGNATAMMRSLRAVKTPWEIGQFRISSWRHSAAYGEIAGCFRPGMTDLEFQYEIEKIMRRHGSLGILRAFGSNMDIFTGSILAGDNAAAASPFDFALGGGGMDDSAPIGANGTALVEGTAVMVDMGGMFTPYITDMTRVFSVGRLPNEAYRAHDAALEIQNEIERTSGPGTSCAEIYNLAAAIAGEKGLSEYFMGTRQQAKFVGHGIGLQINEMPVLSPRSKERLEVNMVFALEPKFVIPGTGAVGIENSFLVTENGLEKITIFEEGIIPLA